MKKTKPVKSHLKKINSGRWMPDPTPQSVARGIRMNLTDLSKVLSPEVIFVAITGRDGEYRQKKDVDRIMEGLGLDIVYKHDVTEKGLPDALLYGDIDIHHSIFDGLMEYVDIVYPHPTEEVVEEVVEEVSETKGEEITSF